MDNSKNQLALFILLVALLPTSSLAGDTPIKFISAGIAFPTPTNYRDFTFGRGEYIDFGLVTAENYLFEVYYFDTVRPARSSRAHDIELDRTTGTGPTDLYSRAFSVSAGISALFFKAKVGISHHEYKLTGPDNKISKSDYGLSYGLGLKFNFYENIVFSIDYNSIDHIIDTANIGLTVFFF